MALSYGILFAPALQVSARTTLAFYLLPSGGYVSGAGLAGPLVHLITAAGCCGNALLNFDRPACLGCRACAQVIETPSLTPNVPLSLPSH